MTSGEVIVAACVLAAGQSKRMGRNNKLLSHINGKTMLQHVLGSIGASAVDETVVVTGFDHQELSNSITEFDVKLIHNQEYSRGLSSSVRLGVASLGRHVDGVLICLADMPFVNAATIDEIVAAFKQSNSIIVPTCMGKDGNPLLWPKSFFKSLQELKGDRGAKYLVNENSEQVNRLDVDNIGIVLDIDDASTLCFFESIFNIQKGEDYAN